MNAVRYRKQSVGPGRYELNRLIALGRVCDRYEATLSDGQSCEICLLHQGVRFGPLAEHLRLVEHVDADAVRGILFSDLTHATPHVALAATGATACDLFQGGKEGRTGNEPGENTSVDLHTLVECLVRTIQRCHRIGLVVGELTESMLSWSVESGWKIDVSALQTNRFLDSAGYLEFDSSTDIYALGTLVLSLRKRLISESDESGAWWQDTFASCVASDSLERPTISELAARLSQRPAGDSAQTIDSGSTSVLYQTVDLPASGLDITSNDDMWLTSNSGRATKRGDLRSGSQVGRYVIESELGVGGMGAVYRAHDQIDNSIVAIKVLNKVAAPDSITARRFVKEARMLAKINSPYVAQLYDVNSEAEFPFIALEYVDGGSLGALLRSNTLLNEKLALVIIADALRGLAVAHQRGVVHRDFKPDNVLLTSAAHDWLAQVSMATADGHPPPPPDLIYAKVSDFGLARAVQQSESLAVTRDGALLGTPLYMSPEQCRGEPAGHASDIYSVGATLFHMLSGNPPFNADTSVALMNKQCHESPPPLRKSRPELSEALVGLVEKCLAKNVDARYQNAGELLNDLEKLVRGEPTSLGLHPPILSLNDPSALRFEHSWEMRSGVASLWPYVSNTDRVNHAIGFPAVKYTLRQDPVHGTQRFAEATIAFQKVRWQEHPYEWIEGKRLSIFREFTDGPFRWFVNIVELNPILGGGTRVTQTLIITPRNWLGVQIARLQLGKKARESFGRIYRQIDLYLQQEQSSALRMDPFVARTALKPDQLRRLSARIEGLQSQGIDPTVIDVLAQFLEHASDLEVARIRPLAFAARYHLDQTHTTNAFLLGSRCGLFTLLWDILCPSCRVPADTQETLKALKDHGYCEACQLAYGIDLSESVELIFRVHPELRDVETRSYCIGGPGSSKHVVAQVRLAPGERFACELQLSEGSYVVRGPNLPFTVDVHVGHMGYLSSCEIPLSRPKNSRGPVQLQVGSQVVLLNNDSGSDQQVRLERTASYHDALSAARASTMALFRELFPGEVLSGEQIVSVTHITVMQIQMNGAQKLYQSLGDAGAFSEIRQELERDLAVVKESGGAVVKTIGEGLLASFISPARAVAAALQLLRLPREEHAKLELSIALHSGPAMAATLDNRLDYFGTTLQNLGRILALAPSNAILASDCLTQGEEVRSLVNELGGRIELHNHDYSHSDVQHPGVIVHSIIPP